MAIATMFETPFLIDTVPDSEALNAELMPLIRGRREADPAGLSRSNRQGWHSDLNIFQWGGPAIRKLGERAIANANGITVDLRQPAGPRYRWDCRGWANSLRQGGSNQYHSHSGAYWSAVYFVDDGYGGSADPALGGEIEFEDPRMPMVTMEEPDLRFRPHRDGPVPEHEIFLRPVTGQMLMFPGWLRHGVRTYLGDGERMSIAINLVATRIEP